MLLTTAKAEASSPCCAVRASASVAHSVTRTSPHTSGLGPSAASSARAVQTVTEPLTQLLAELACLQESSVRCKTW